MRRTFLILLISCFVLFACSVAYADVDLATLSDDDLLALQKAMNTELVSRGLIAEVTIPVGVYETGIDIPVGKYVLTAIKDATLYSTPQILVYPDMKSYVNRNSSSHKLYLINQGLSAGESCTVSLEDGYILYLRGSDFIMKKFNLSMFE